MTSEDLAQQSRRDRMRAAIVVAALVLAAVLASIVFLKPGLPQRIVLASGSEFGLYHAYAKRYITALAHDGVTVEERLTHGAAENLQLLLDPKSGVGVAFLQGGVAQFPEADGLVMLASLYYEPLWIFYRDSKTLDQLGQLQGKRIAIGVAGSGTLAFVERLIAVDALSPQKSDLRRIGGPDALSQLKSGEVDAILLVGGAQTPMILQALQDPDLKLMSLVNAEAFPRRLPYVTRLTLPQGTIDLRNNIPQQDVAMIATEAMLVARDDLPPALINLFLDAGRELHGRQGAFEAAGEFPNTAHVDLAVSSVADQHKRFGPSFLYRYLPFWLATLVERLIIVVIPLLVIVIPVVRYLPDVLRHRVRSRIYRWYGELALLEHDVGSRQGDLPIAQWLQDLDRIDRAVAQIRTPAGFASEAYTLREHIGLVRRDVIARRDS